MPTIKQCKANPLRKGCGWKKNKKTNFEARWDKGTTEIHILKQGKFVSRSGERNYLIEGSKSVGGYFGVGKTYARTKKEALKIAKDYMGKHPRG